MMRGWKKFMNEENERERRVEVTVVDQEVTRSTERVRGAALSLCRPRESIYDDDG